MKGPCNPRGTPFPPQISVIRVISDKVLAFAFAGLLIPIILTDEEL